MSLKTELPEPIEQHDVAKVADRPLATIGAATTALMLAVIALYHYFLPGHLRGTDYWFWGSGALIGILLVYVGVYPRSPATALRSRTMAFCVLVLVAVMLTAYGYHRSTFLGSTDWRWFWVYEVSLGVWLIYAIAQVFRKVPKR